MKAEVVYVSLGSNLGDRFKNIKTAISFLKQTKDIEVLRVSKVIETKPQGYLAQEDFLNAVAKIKTGLSPKRLLSLFKDIEHRLKREKTIKNGPRTIDLDILLYGDKEIRKPYLSIPHPRMLKRRFVIEPLLEIEPDIFDTHPLLKIHKDKVEI